VSRPRAAIVVTGSELVRGERTDLNGPFFARQALELGLEPARITIVGDRPDELEDVLRTAVVEADLCFVSGGLGPTHDDRTVELVAKVAGHPMVVDAALEDRIEEISRMIADRLNRPYADFTEGVRKQATVPAGAIVLGPAGTAPGLVVGVNGCVIVVMPGPPSELRRLWPLALETAPVRDVLGRARPPGRRALRFYGASESAVAKALADVGGDGNGVEATICARDFEIHVDLVVDPGADERADAIAAGLREPLARFLFAEDERTVQEIVLGECRAQGLTLATAESCTGGMVAARLTDVPGSSDVFVGGVVAYSDEVKARELDVPEETLRRHGAVSAETAAAMALGARRRLAADLGVAVTGIAGPDGGTDEKPVGLVFFHASGPGGEEALRFELPGDRGWIRSRSTVVALHLLRRLLQSARGGADS
jgi:nicotinamide-nucleotide amidase